MRCKPHVAAHPEGVLELDLAHVLSGASEAACSLLAPVAHRIPHHLVWPAPAHDSALLTTRTHNRVWYTSAPNPVEVSSTERFGCGTRQRRSIRRGHYGWYARRLHYVDW